MEGGRREGGARNEKNERFTRPCMTTCWVDGPCGGRSQSVRVRRKCWSLRASASSVENGFNTVDFKSIHPRSTAGGDGAREAGHPRRYSPTDLTRRFRQCSHPTPTDTLLAALADAALSHDAYLMPRPSLK